MSRHGGRVGIEHDCGPLEPGGDLREQLKPLASQRGFEGGEAGDVPTWAVKPRDDAAGDGVAPAKDDWDRPRLPLEGDGRRGRVCQDDVRLQADQLCGERSYPIDVTAAPPKVDPQVAAIGPAQARKRLRKRRDHSLRHGIVFVVLHEHADTPDAVALLRARRERPRYRRAAEAGDEFAPSKANPHLALPFQGALSR